jgi:5-methyltetrahydropteroyltriglutamate--homocysteine methyltransferase
LLPGKRSSSTAGGNFFDIIDEPIMQRSDEKILTTHVGSLIRSPEFVALLKAADAGDSGATGRYPAQLAAAVAQIVREQEAIGIDVVSDGEFGKSASWSRYILERLTGFEQRAGLGLRSGEIVAKGRDRERFPEFYAEYDKTQGFVGTKGNWACIGPITYKGHEVIRRDIENLKAALPGARVTEAFMAAVAPGSVIPDRLNEYYKDDADFIFAVADALNEEYRAIVDAGFLLQLDDAHLPIMYERMVPPARFADYLAWADLRIEALNCALSGIPEDRVRYHLCWGSWNAPHTGDVPLKDIVHLLLRLRVGAYSIEAANVRHEHEWRLWETVKLPAHKILIPGVISHATNVVEHPELVAERIVRFASLVGRENIMAGTDCGFAQGPYVQRVHPSIMWSKLQALVEGAQLATSKLWHRRAA